MAVGVADLVGEDFAGSAEGHSALVGVAYFEGVGLPVEEDSGEASSFVFLGDKDRSAQLVEEPLLFGKIGQVLAHFDVWLVEHQ